MIRLFPIVVAGLVGLPLAAQQTAPVIDMHLHAQSAFDRPRALCVPPSVHGVVAPQCAHPLWSAATEDELIAQTIAALDRLNVRGVISGPDLARVSRFVDAGGGRLIPGYMLNLGDEGALSPSALRTHLADGTVQVLGEIENQYAGITPSDPRMDPYWALAVEFDIPVALHLGEAYPGAPQSDSPRYRVGLGSPLLLEDLLTRFPTLRLYVMHYGSPFIDEMISILYHYPNVYVDLGGNLWAYPREYVWSQLRQLVAAGFARRIMFGSDQMRWPGLIEESIRAVEEAPFLSPSQKRDILYRNAARFLRLDTASPEGAPASPPAEGR